LHFHLGSQITNIRQVKAAITEASRVYVDLSRRGAGLEYLDVGGGLGVDYDGSQTNFQSSMNYTLQEYANDVVHHMGSVCDEAGVPHPTIISESGRAVAAYHSALVFSVLGVASQGNGEENLLDIPPDSEQPLHDPLRFQPRDRRIVFQRSELRALALDEGDRLPQGVGHRQNVGEQNRRIETEAPHRLQSRFRRQLRAVAEGEKSAGLFPQRPILGQVAAGLAHQPDRRRRRNRPAENREKRWDCRLL